MANKTSSPKGGKRGCLCKNGTYSSKCCDGSLQAQGIGSITGTSETENFLAQENGSLLLQETNYKIKI
jgi:hypothetical protein